jgi:carbamoyltransferase
MRYTLGINCSGFHSSACLLGDGVLYSAICEERLSRVKRDKAFPHRAVNYCCEAAGIEFRQISDAFMGWHPRHYLRKSDHMLGEALRSRGKLSHVALNELAAHAELDLSDVEHRLRTANSDLTVHFVDHHQAHLAHAFYGSGFPSADFMVLDGFGELTTGMCGHAAPGNVDAFVQYPTPHSMGSFYSAFTDFMGFQPDGDEWKVMALSALGDSEVYYDRIRPLVRVDGLRFELDLSYFEHYIYFKNGYYSTKLVELLGPPPAPGAAPGKRECDIVAAVQRVAEETLFSLLGALHARTGSEDLVVGGGFFMNSVLNGKLHERTPYRRVFIGGSPDDSGISIGSALYGASNVLKIPVSREAMRHNYFGRPYSNDEILAELTRRKIQHIPLDDAPAAGARLIRDGKILGWFQGGSEFGQRALGNRSILADPTRPEMKDAVNASVKYREGFRPFAPAVLSEHQQEVLDIPGDATACFMEKVFRIRPEWQARVPAVTHFDGTGRPQTVLQRTNPRFHALITEFERMTGIPLVLNTSFNVNGMPLVETPGDAISCFFACGLDALILGDFLVEK